MDPHLERLHREIGAVVTGLTNVDMRPQPAGKWSAAEILEHLYLTYTGTVKGFRRMLEAGKPLARKPTWKNRVQAFVVVGFGYMPVGREAPAQARPRGIAVETVLTEIVPEIARMDEIITQSETRFGRRLKVLDHPILGPFSTSQWRKFHLVHGMHHLKQIQHLRALQ